MARWSDIAQWRGPTPNQSGPMQEQRGLILHVMQGSYEGSISWGKNPASNVSFHFATAKDGRCGQLVDTDVTAWTQGSGNGHWLSVENEDFNTNPLSAQQLENVARIYARGVQTYGWPLQSTDSVNGRGLGWHGMGGAAWGGHTSCPGEPIKAQRPAILARAAEILGAPPPEDNMGWLTDERAEVLWWRVEALLTNRETVYAGATAGEPNQLRAKLAEIDAQIEALAVGGVDVAALAAALVADPAFKAALDQAAFEGAQRAEDE